MANKEDATSRRDMVKAKTGYKMTVPAAMKLSNRFTGDLLADAEEAMPLDTKAPFGYIMAYCKKHASEEPAKETAVVEDLPW